MKSLTEFFTTTCKPMAVSFQCMTKFTTNLKKKKKEKNFFFTTKQLKTGRNWKIKYSQIREN